jgi:hypothetical protein
MGLFSCFTKVAIEPTSVAANSIAIIKEDTLYTNDIKIEIRRKNNKDCNYMIALRIELCMSLNIPIKILNNLHDDDIYAIADICMSELDITVMIMSLQLIEARNQGIAIFVSAIEVSQRNFIASSERINKLYKRSPAELHVLTTDNEFMASFRNAKFVIKIHNDARILKYNAQNIDRGIPPIHLAPDLYA